MSYLNLPNLMEGKFQDQGQLDQDFEDWLYSGGIQPDHGLLSEEDKQESIKIEGSYPEGAITSNQAPEGEISTMMLVKWSDKV